MCRSRRLPKRWQPGVSRRSQPGSSALRRSVRRIAPWRPMRPAGRWSSSTADEAQPHADHFRDPVARWRAPYGATELLAKRCRPAGWPRRRSHRNRSSRPGVVKTTEGGCPTMNLLINASMSTLAGNIWTWRTVRAKCAPYAAIPLRLIVGYGFLAHGLAKWHSGPEAFAAILHAIGVPAPQLMAWVTIAT